MIKISVLYANRDGARFDVNYYKDQHMAMVRQLLTPFGLRGTAIDRGLSGGAPGSPAPFICAGHLLFDSVEAFRAGFDRHGKTLMADIPNYTDCKSTVQISEVIE